MKGAKLKGKSKSVPPKAAAAPVDSANEGEDDNDNSAGEEASGSEDGDLFK